jgi:hypothetical protein
MQIHVEVNLDLDEVPDRIMSQIDDVEQKLSLYIEDNREHLSARNVASSVVLHNLVNMRSLLAKFDQVLQESVEMIQVYEGAILQRKAIFLKHQAEQMQSNIEQDKEPHPRDGDRPDV